MLSAGATDKSPSRKTTSVRDKVNKKKSKLANKSKKGKSSSSRKGKKDKQVMVPKDLADPQTLELSDTPSVRPTGLQIFTATPMRVAVTGANFVSFLLVLYSLIKFLKNRPSREREEEDQQIPSLSNSNQSSQRPRENIRRGNVTVIIRSSSDSEAPRRRSTEQQLEQDQSRMQELTTERFEEEGEGMNIPWNMIAVAYVPFSYTFAGITYLAERFERVGLASFWTGFITLLVLSFIHHKDDFSFSFGSSSEDREDGEDNRRRRSSNQDQERTELSNGTVVRDRSSRTFTYL